MPVEVNGTPLEFDVIVNTDFVGEATNKVKREMSIVTKEVEKEAASIDNVIKKAAGAIAAYSSIATATNFVSDIARVRGEFQQLEVAFTTMLGSREKADKLMAQVTQFASTTPFELKEVASTTKQLLAFGIEADKIEGTLRSLGDVAAGIGAPLGDIAYLFGTIKTAGVANAIDIKQFAQRGIPIYEELAKVLKVNTQEVGELVSAGKVGFPEVEKAFQSMTATGSKFGGLMAEQAKTITGLQSNFKDAVDRMLNDIGKSQEGSIAAAIKGATSLVENYQTVLDVIKVLIVTYGSYKAATIASSVATTVYDVATKRLVISQTLQATAQTIATRSMALLNSAMLSNPAVAVATGIAALVSAFVVFRKETSSVVSAQKLLADTQSSVSNSLAETEAKIRPYVEALKNANLSEKERIDIYNKLREIDPDIVKGLTAKTISYDALTKNVNAYLGALRNQIALETNRNAVVASIKIEQEIQKQIDEKQKTLDKLNKLNSQSGSYVPGVSSGGVGSGIKAVETQSQINTLQNQLAQQKKVTQELGESGRKSVQSTDEQTKAVQRTVKVIDEEIEALKKQQVEVSKNSKEWANYSAQIKKLQDERERITGPSSKEVRSQQQDIDHKKQELQALLKDIDSAENDARRSGLEKEESEIDRLNKAFDDLVKRAKEIDAGSGIFQRIEKARGERIGNERLKNEAEEYKKSLDRQRQMFEDFEEAKKNIGIEKAEQMYREQTKGFESFAKFLQSEIEKNKGNSLITKALKTALSDVNKQQTDAELKRIQDLVSATLTYKDQELLINRKYNQMVVDLDSKKGKEVIKNEGVVRAAIEAGRKQELEDLQNNLLRQSELYKKLGKDIIGLSRNQIKDLVKSLQNDLKNGFTFDADGNKVLLTPEMEQRLKSGIEQGKEFLNSTNKVSGLTSKEFDEIAKKAQSVSGVFNTLAQSIEPINANLAGVLSQMGELASLAGNAASGLAAFASGNYFEAAQAGANIIGQIVGVFAEAIRTAKEARRVVDEFNQAILFGTINTNIALREQMALESKRNKLRLDGLKAEKKALEENSKASAAEFNRLFEQLQNEQFIASEKAKKGKGSALFGLVGVLTGLGGQTKVSEELKSLAGKTFEQIEQLFNSGQLTEKAKALFVQLQKLKQEGIDIDRQLEDIKRQSQELYTGTTSDNILNGIIDGFKSGLRSAEDFASSFEDMMRNAVLQSLKFKYLEGPVNDIFNQFAAFSESDGQLTKEEIEQLKKSYNEAITKAGEKLKDLQNITGVSLISANGTNSLTGGVKAMTEQTAEVIGGQLAGMRRHIGEQLIVATNGLNELISIQQNTAILISRVEEMNRLWRGVIDGNKLRGL